MSRLACAGVLAFTAASVGAQPQADRRAVDATAADIDAILKQVPQDAATDSTVRVVDAGGYHVGVFVVNRPKGALRNLDALREHALRTLGSDGVEQGPLRSTLRRQQLLSNG